MDVHIAIIIFMMPILDYMTLSLILYKDNSALFQGMKFKI